MEVLPYHFKTLSLYDVCKLENQNFTRFRRFNFWFLTFLLCWALVGVLIEAVTTKDGDKRMESFIYFFGFSAAWFKLLNAVSQIDLLKSVAKDFQNPILDSLTDEEIMIRERAGKIATWIYWFFVAAALIVVTIVMIVPLVEFHGKQLPFAMYGFSVPMSMRAFLPMYLLQFCLVYWVSVVDMCLDNLLYGFLILITEQIRILCLRLEHLTSTDVNIDDCIRHHLMIRGIFQKVQEIFIGVTIYFFASCIFVICISIYAMSQVIINEY